MPFGDNNSLFYEQIVKIRKTLETYIKFEAKSCPSGTQIHFFIKKVVKIRKVHPWVARNEPGKGMASLKRSLVVAQLTRP